MGRRRREILFASAGCFFDGITILAAVYAAALLILNLFGIRSYIVLSGSMEPAIRTGSLCFVDTKAEFEEIGPGDVIAFETAGGALVTHRAINVSGGRVETKGDANEVSDGFAVTAENYEGETLFSVPCLGYLNHLLSRNGWMLFGVLPLSVWLIKSWRPEGK